MRLIRLLLCARGCCTSLGEAYHYPSSLAKSQYGAQDSQFRLSQWRPSAIGHGEARSLVDLTELPRALFEITARNPHSRNTRGLLRVSSSLRDLQARVSSQDNID